MQNYFLPTPYNVDDISYYGGQRPIAIISAGTAGPDIIIRAITATYGFSFDEALMIFRYFSRHIGLILASGCFELFCLS